MPPRGNKRTPRKGGFLLTDLREYLSERAGRPLNSYTMRSLLKRAGVTLRWNPDPKVLHFFHDPLTPAEAEAVITEFHRGRGAHELKKRGAWK